MAAKKKAKKKLTLAQKRDDILTKLLWNTNDEDVLKELRAKAVDFSGIPTPSGDFDGMDAFEEVIMEADRVYYEMKDAIKDLFVAAAIKRGVPEKVARLHINKSWK